MIKHANFQAVEYVIVTGGNGQVRKRATALDFSTMTQRQVLKSFRQWHLIRLTYLMTLQQRIFRTFPFRAT